MLKIKDNVDLKELEKKYKHIIVFPAKYEDFYLYVNEDRHIDMPVDYGVAIDEFDTLYDLIKDGLVEKVEE